MTLTHVIEFALKPHSQLGLAAISLSAQSPLTPVFSGHFSGSHQSISGCAFSFKATHRDSPGRLAQLKRAVGFRPSTGTNGLQPGTIITEAPATFSLPPGVTSTERLSARDAVAIALWNNADLQADLAGLDVSRAELTEAALFKNPSFSTLFAVGPKPFELPAGMAD